MGSGLGMGHFWPSDSPSYIIPKKKKAVPVPPKARTIMAFAGSHIRLRDYQTSTSPISPTAHPLQRMKAVKGENG